ncbi:hypothetical protein UFOVP32_60 [uncultured Caudovirales phage]|uniref:DUF932 domain-containing protein n=1 Tax=uncultured Caudovirales phage TaxID=2100421 RepID=A0A6J5KQS0_9CAUD|nr:hypothetical protein UFOVP32_60 [uncultured Caudovirales phage]CAB4123575.1 hypothetical protein UFOVP50_16 [uncultured Caudovirales phage]
MHQIDVSKGQTISTVSQQWANRSPDERFTSLGELRKQVALWADQSFAEEVQPNKMHVGASEGGGLHLIANDALLDLTNFSFQQVARLADAPANYLRGLPAPLAALNLNYGLKAAQPKTHSLYMRNDAEDRLLRGVTSPRYGRIFDRDVVDAVMAVAGDGTGDTRWKVPGTIDWGSQHGVSYNPQVDITKENTTLYASDRDIFLFLVDDMNPIEVGKLASGAPDLMFRGFYVWNSEVGQRTFGVATMYLRGVCQNRNLWGVEDFSEITFKHSAGAPERFVEMAAPALHTYAEANTQKLVAGVKAAKAAKLAKNDEERIEFFGKFGFSEKQARGLIATSLAEEGVPPVSAWDFAQAVSAQARKAPFQEQRLALEMTAGKILDKVI